MIELLSPAKAAFVPVTGRFITLAAELGIIIAHLYVLKQLLLSAVSSDRERPLWRRWLLVSALTTGILQVFHVVAVGHQSAAWMLALAMSLGGAMSLLAVSMGRVRMSDTVMAGLLLLGFLGSSVLALGGHGVPGLSHDGVLLELPGALLVTGGLSYMVAATIALRLESRMRDVVLAVAAYCVCMAVACLVLVLVGDYQLAHAWASIPRFLAGGAIGVFAWLSYRALGRVEGEDMPDLPDVEPSRKRPEVRRPTILAVDDDPMVLGLMQAVFSELGTVSSATSKREVETRLMQGDMPDLVVLDLNLEDGQAHDLVPTYFRDRAAASRLLIYSVESYPSRLLPKGARSLLKSDTPIDRLRDMAANVLSNSARGGGSVQAAG
jgi:CheY-like chemotaxis protein